jgi:hypothetical protein
MLVGACRGEPRVVTGVEAAPSASAPVPVAPSVPAPSASVPNEVAPVPAPVASAPRLADAGVRGLLLYDPNREGGVPAAFESKLSPVDEERVLGRVFPGKHLGNLAECNDVTPEPDDDPAPDNDGSRMLAAQRKAGAFAPRIEQAVRGAFTAPRVDETLYVIAMMECGVNISNGYGTTTVAVMNGDKVAARSLEPGNTRVAGVVDGDGDGRDEVLFEQGFYWGGVGQNSARLVHVEPGKLALLRDFGKILETDCGGVNKGTRYSVLYVKPKPGGPAAYTVEKRAAKCDPIR